MLYVSMRACLINAENYKVDAYKYTYIYESIRNLILEA